MRSSDRNIKSFDQAQEFEVLNDIIAVCRDGCEFYHFAEQQVEDHTLKNLFLGMARIRAELVSELEAQISVKERLTTRQGKFLGKLQKWYGNVKSKIGHCPEAAVLKELVECESSTITTLRQSIKKIRDRSLLKILSSKLASLQMSFDRMKILRETRYSN